MSIKSDRSFLVGKLWHEAPTKKKQLCARTSVKFNATAGRSPYHCQDQRRGRTAAESSNVNWYNSKFGMSDLQKAAKGEHQ
jgi:hypothetical protein